MAESTRKWLNLSAYNLHLYMPADSPEAYVQSTVDNDVKALAAINKLVEDNGFSISEGQVVVPAKELMKVATTLVEREVVTLPVSETQRPKDVAAKAATSLPEVVDNAASDEVVTQDQGGDSEVGRADLGDIENESQPEPVDMASTTTNRHTTRLNEMPPKSDSTDFPGSELLTLGSNDFRGMEFAIVLKDGSVHTSGGTPLLGDPNHPTSRLDYYIDMTDNLGADLWVAPNIARKARTAADLNGNGLVFGYTWSQINAMQQGKKIDYEIKPEIPEGAVLFYSASPLADTKSAGAETMESKDSVATEQEDEPVNEAGDLKSNQELASHSDSNDDDLPADESLEASAPIEKHLDVGRKVGGAKKDLRGASHADFERAYAQAVDYLKDDDAIQAAELLTHIQESAAKSNVWPPINWKQEKENGMSPRVAAFIKTIRDSLDSKPSVNLLRTKPEALDGEIVRVIKYIEIVSRYRDSVKDLKTDEQLDSMIAKMRDMEADDPGYRGNYDEFNKKYAKELRTMPFMVMQDAIVEISGQPHSLRNYDVGRKFGRRYNYANHVYNLNQAVNEARRNQDKASWRHNDQWSFVIRPSRGRSSDKAESKPQDPTPEHLTHIDRKGPDWRPGDRNVTGKDLMQTFGFSGIEYGKWLPNKERQVVLNYAFDAFMDLSKVLGVSPKVLSLEGTLALAFGSRGNGGKNSASAHYEPSRKVINLTRIRGAGTAAHEWFHALDDFLGGKLSPVSSNRLSAARDSYITHSQTMTVDDRKAHGPGLSDLDNVIQKVSDLNKAIMVKPLGAEVAKQDAIKKAEDQISYTKHGVMWAKSFFDHQKTNLGLNRSGRLVLGALVDEKELVKFVVEDAFAQRYQGALSDKTPDRMMAHMYSSYIDTVASEYHVAASSGKLNLMHSEIIEKMKEQGVVEQHINEVMDQAPNIAEYIERNRIKLADFERRISARDEADRGITRDAIRLFGKTEVEQINLIAYSRYQAGLSAMERIVNGDRDEDFSRTTTNTQFYYEAKVLDKKRKDAYWSRPTELGARAFEAFTMDALTNEGLQNDYLTAHASESKYASKEKYKGNPYPVGDERAAINNAFEQLSQAIAEYAIAIDMDGKADEKIKHYIDVDEDDGLRMSA